MHTAVACVHKCFTLTGGLKSDKSECLWSSAEHTAEAVAWQEKYIYPKAKIVKSLHHYVLSQWKRFWICIYVHCSSMRSQMSYPDRQFEIWQVRMFVKQRPLPSANVCEAGLITKCERFWSSRTGSSSNYLLLKIVVHSPANPTKHNQQ